MAFGRPQIKPPSIQPIKKLETKYQQGSQSQATGNRTYNGFAPSPHAGGGLAKAGYQKRDQTAKNKKSFLMNKLKSGGF